MYVKKSHLFGFIGIIALLAAAPWIDGVLYKRDFFNTVAIINADSPVKIKVLEYRLGWFSSDAKVQIESIKPGQLGSMQPMQAQALESALKYMVFNEHIVHGPLVHNPATNRWTPALALIDNSIHIDTVERMLGNPNPKGVLSAQTLVGFGGDYVSYVQSMSIVSDIPNVGKISWSGLKGTVTTGFSSNHVSLVKSDLIFGALQLDSPDKFSLKTVDYSLKSEMTRQGNGLWNGQQVFGAPLFSISTADNENFQVEGVNLTHDFGMSPSKFYDVKVNYSIQNLSLPNISISPINLKLAFMSLDPNIMKQMMSSPQLTEDQQMALVPRLITANSVVNGNLGFQTTAGRFAGDLDVRWPANMLPTSPEKLYSNANVKMNARISIAMFNQFMDLMDQEYKKKQGPDVAPASSMAADTTATDSANSQSDTAQLDALVEQGKIKRDVADQLAQLQDAQLSPEIYSATLDNLVVRKEIPADVAASLKATYMKPKVVAVNKPKPAQTAPLPSVAIKQQLQNQIKQGYVIQENDDYVIAVTVDQGVTKVNGKVFQPGQMEAGMPEAQPQSAPQSEAQPQTAQPQPAPQTQLPSTQPEPSVPTQPSSTDTTTSAPQ
jgi:uncharacterized protein YdgA (DUF945 family)